MFADKLPWWPEYRRPAAILTAQQYENDPMAQRRLVDNLVARYYAPAARLSVQDSLDHRARYYYITYDARAWTGRRI